MWELLVELDTTREISDGNRIGTDTSENGPDVIRYLTAILSPDQNWIRATLGNIVRLSRRDGHVLFNPHSCDLLNKHGTFTNVISTLITISSVHSRYKDF